VATGPANSWKIHRLAWWFTRPFALRKQLFAGPIPIEEVEIGTYVLGYHEETGKIGYYPVTYLISHLDFKVVYLTIDGETIVTTVEHPFYTAEDEWVDALDLVVGDEVRTAEWTTGVVENVYEVTRPQPMYNFTVDVAHTYFIGENQWLVHNCTWGKHGARSSIRKFYASSDFKMNDLETIAKQMGYDPENFHRSTKNEFVIDMMAHAQRHEDSAKLIAFTKKYINESSHLSNDLIDTLTDLNKGADDYYVWE